MTIYQVKEQTKNNCFAGDTQVRIKRNGKEFFCKIAETYDADLILATVQGQDSWSSIIKPVSFECKDKWDLFNVSTKPDPIWVTAYHPISKCQDQPVWLDDHITPNNQNPAGMKKVPRVFNLICDGPFNIYSDSKKASFVTIGYGCRKNIAKCHEGYPGLLKFAEQHKEDMADIQGNVVCNFRPETELNEIASKFYHHMPLFQPTVYKPELCLADALNTLRTKESLTNEFTVLLLLLEEEKNYANTLDLNIMYVAIGHCMKTKVDLEVFKYPT